MIVRINGAPTRLTEETTFVTDNGTFTITPEKAEGEQLSEAVMERVVNSYFRLASGAPCPVPPVLAGTIYRS